MMSSHQTVPVTGCLSDVITNLFGDKPRANLGGHGSDFATSAPQVHDFDLVEVELRRQGGGGWCRMNVNSGPDYIKEHLPKIHPHTSYIGENRPVLEKTGNLQYLWRPAPHRSMPARYKHEYVGGIGWGVQKYNFINKSRLESGFHIKDGELNQAAIDKLSHRYQNPWQPKPHVLDMQGKYSRAFMAWHMGDYEDTDQRNSKWAMLVKENNSLTGRPSKSPLLPKLPIHKKDSHVGGEIPPYPVGQSYTVQGTSPVNLSPHPPRHSASPRIMLTRNVPYISKTLLLKTTHICKTVWV
ncbi:uncharacterized protein C4orf45 homolog [Nycticebus coucang]|uniref:uncharacterized protein C4orf45 homolog n=1 Tax=Nycticebus coucang TaxID=9470 RepID=UPI00234DD13D|nr:uncharacterized protein C4orf45 homolog [Nycticebus coucang]